MFHLEMASGGYPGVVIATPTLPALVTGAGATLSVDQSGRLVTTTQRRPVQDGPVFVIAAGQTISNDVDPQAAFVAGAANAVTLYDDPARLAPETLSLQVAAVAVPAAGDWRVLQANILAGTLNIAAIPNSAIFQSRRMRFVSAVAVGAGGRSFVTTYIS